jgi:hypothetical protein
MRLPRIRMTTRRWMVAVAVVAFGLAGAIQIPRLRDRREQYLKMAAHWGEWEATLHQHPNERTNQVIAYYARMRAKYEHAARYPWIQVDSASPHILDDDKPK